MSSRTLAKLGLLAVASALVLVVGGGAGIADDTALFSTAVAPNVLLVVDNSGSMNNIVWHPAFDPSQTPTCTTFDNNATYFLAQDTTYSTCGRTRVLYHDPKVLPYYTRYDGRYLNWLFSPESDPYYPEIQQNGNGLPSSCVGGAPYAKYKRARITAAKQVLKEIICNVNAVGAVRFGIATFRVSGDPNGGYVRVPVDDYNSQQAADLDAAIQAIDANTWTPLAETLFSVYTYFMSRNVNDIPVGQDGQTKFPKYSYKTDPSGVGGAFSSSGPPTVPDSPVQYSCQKNFVILITDGEPTMDDFNRASPTNTALGYNDFAKLIGDYNPDGEVESQPNAVCGGCRTSLYLDDIALFMQTNDFRPDLADNQVIDVYTVGFTTSPFANALLAKTAQVGNGLFFFSNNAEDLAQAIIGAVTDIIQKSQSFTAATVPATRTADGGNLYASLFIPSDKTPYWEGHLRNYEITASGEIHAASGTCAVDDPTPGECFSGPFLPVDQAPPFWDAGEQVPSPGNRNLFVSKLVNGTPTRVAFDTGLDAADLGVTFPPAAPYPGSSALNAEGLADEIVQNVRGCTFGTGVQSADVSNPQPCSARSWLLGDIFHSNPVVVGPPAFHFNEPSYQVFESNFATRKRVIYAGANDGFLHGFLAGVWQPNANPPAYDHGTGAELFGFMPWPSRQRIKDLPVDTGSRDVYFVDGDPVVSDAWFYSTPTAATKAGNGSEWRTVLVGSLRQGGRAYYALDVTDPDDPSYPGYLWEFPAENDPAGVLPYMGETWGDAVITKIRVRVGANDNGGLGFERWVAIVSGGYDPSGDPNDPANYDPNATAGRALFVLDLKTGAILAEMKFDPTAPAGSPEEQMRYAIASTPAVFDLDFDGYADVIYVGDLGGNVWKWVIHPIGDDRVNDGSGRTDQPSWTFRRFFQAPTHSKAGITYYKSFFFPPAGTMRNGTFWLAFASGERANLNLQGDPNSSADNNRFYAVTDLDPYEVQNPAYPVLGESDLLDVTSDPTCADTSGYRGYYFVADETEKFVTNIDIFFYHVFLGSFVPTSSSDPCQAGGQAYLYVFRVYCGEGFFQAPGGSPARRLLLGAGIPTDPRITVGTDGTDDSNRVIVTKQEGDILNLKGPAGFNSGIGQLYWRELR